MARKHTKDVINSAVPKMQKRATSVITSVKYRMALSTAFFAGKSKAVQVLLKRKGNGESVEMELEVSTRKLAPGKSLGLLSLL